VEDWQSFAPMVRLLADSPDLVREILAVQASFAARLAANILGEVEVDAAIFSEPIAGNHGSLISPRMYREIVLASYTPIFEVLESFKVPVTVWRTYANPRALIPEIARARFNAVWACEAPPGAMDPYELRQALGPAFGLIGGINATVLYQGRAEMRRAVEAVLPLAAEGRFIPQADGRVREDVPYENYLYYRETLETLVRSHETSGQHQPGQSQAR
jgi:uroporphyrinogen-III decarboxylase